MWWMSPDCWCIAATVMLLERKPRTPVATCAARKVWKNGLAVLVVSSAAGRATSQNPSVSTDSSICFRYAAGPQCADASDVLLPGRLEAPGVATGEHRHHEPAPNDSFAISLREGVVSSEAKVERVGEVERVLRSDHVGGNEAGRLDDHQEVLKVVLFHDRQQRGFQRVVGNGDAGLVDLAGFRISA